jgi:hypothetical protein
MSSAMSDLTKKLRPVIAPLKKKEERTAIEAATAYLSKELSDHYRILGAELRIDKPPDAGKIPDRMIGVVLADYGKRRNLEVLVDARGKVAKVIDLKGAQPAYNSEEIADARAIAEQDSRVAYHAGEKGSFTSEFGPERAGDNARRIGLRYAVAEKGRIVGGPAHAIVDLSARKLVHFDEPSAESGSRR